MREWLARLIDWYRRDRLEAELAEELRFHQTQIERDERVAGVAPDDVTWAARRKLGNLTSAREAARERWSLPWLDHLQQDTRYAIRGLRRSPAFTLSVVVTLGLGIGANAAIFSVVDRLLLRPPPMLIEPARVNHAYVSFPMPDGSGERIQLDAVSYARAQHLQQWTTTFDRKAIFSAGTMAVGVGQEARELPVAATSASFFEFFDAPPSLGRYFTAFEDRPPGGSAVAVLSHGTWQSRFGGRRDVLGATVDIGPAKYTVIGVAPKGFAGLWPDQPPIAFVPFTTWAAASFPPSRGETWEMSMTLNIASLLVRRREGVTTSAASSDLTAAMLKSWEAEGGPPDLEPLAVAASVLTERGPNQTSAARVAALVGGMALVVLLIAGANVANLLLARALRRRREIALRLAIGISRGRLLAQLLTESVLLALLGGVVALAVAQAGGATLRGVLLPANADAPIVSDTRTLVVIAMSVVAVGILTGLAPAWQAGRVDVTRHLKASARDGGTQRSHTRVALLVVQAAFSVLLLVGAALFVLSLGNVKQVPLGYDADPVLAVEPVMRGVVLDTARTIALRERLLAASARIPGVERASLTMTIPLARRRVGSGIRVPGMDIERFQRLPEMYVNAVTPEYFATIGTRIVRGRGIDASDVAGAPDAIVVSNSLARVLWPGKDAIGQCVILSANTPRPCGYVVGVAEDIKQTGFQNDPGLMYYRAVAQWYDRNIAVIVRMRGPAGPEVETVRQALQREMPGASYVRVSQLADRVRREMKSWQLGATMFVAFGGLALVLAAIGLYSVVSYNMAQRTHEMGVRRALGAQPGDVVGLVVRQGLLLAGLGVAIGTVVTFVASGTVAPMLFDVSPHDPLIYAFAAGVMFIVAAAASAIPAIRAARVDPNVALRAD